MSESNILINDLSAQIIARRIVVVVGAGISAAATKGVPAATWLGLLREGVTRCEAVVTNLPPGWGDRVRMEIASGDIDDLLSAAEKIATKLANQGGEYSRWLRETVGALRVQDSRLIKALAGLGVPLLTTNYDSLIEDVTGWPAVTWRQSSAVEYLIRGDEQGVLHLHGHWQDPQSVVLGIRSYSQILGDTHAQAILQALRATRSLLFIGFGAGLTDPNFSALLRWARDAFSMSEYRHYRLVRSSEVAAVQADYEPSDRIFVLPYGDNYEDLPPFLERLVARSTESSTSNRAKALPIGRHGVKIFISYSHQDKRYLELLDRHLAGLRRRGILEFWTDRQIRPGDDWSSEISSNIDDAEVILLLVSADFLASDYCYSAEMTRALERHRAGSARVIPIILRPVDWAASPLGNLQALPRGAKPITRWSNRDEAYVDIVNGIERVVAELHTTASQTSQRAVLASGAGTVSLVDTKRTPLADATLDRPVHQLGEVFVKQGEPILTFIEPPLFKDLKLVLLQAGRGVIVEGPSGIGKTTAVLRAISEMQGAAKLSQAASVELLSARRQADVARLETIQQWHQGIAVIDDFHRLPRELNDSVVNHLKYLADTSDRNRKLVIIGIPKTNQTLVDISFDLATRIEVLAFNKVDDDLVLELIRKGESALNIQFDRPAEIALAAGGSLNIAQYLCYHLCKKSDTLESQRQPTVVTCQLESAIEDVLIELSRKFREAIRRFIGLGGVTDRTCARLIEALAQSDDGSVSLIEFKDTAPLAAAGLKRFKKEQWLRRLFAEIPDAERMLFYDDRAERLTIDDPQLGFYLRRISLEQLARAAGVVQLKVGRIVLVLYVREDRRWFDRLRVHLGPLEQQGLVQLDAWEADRLGVGENSAIELRRAMEAASVILCIISADYLISEFMGGDTAVLIDSLMAGRNHGARVVSLVARPCHYDGTGIESFPVENPSTPLSSMDEANVDETLANVVGMIANHVS